jgi:hypothetical protein
MSHMSASHRGVLKTIAISYVIISHLRTQWITSQCSARVERCPRQHADEKGKDLI